MPTTDTRTAVEPGSKEDPYVRAIREATRRAMGDHRPPLSAEEAGRRMALMRARAPTSPEL